MSALAVEETGLELLARLQTSHISLIDLEPRLFPGGPLPGQLIELCGKPGSGKSKYVVHVIANVILSTVYKGLSLGGLGASVILVDTDHLFCLLRLVSVLEHRIISAMDSHNERVTSEGQLINDISSGEELNDRGVESIHLSEEQVESCVKSCLARLHIVRCINSMQLLMTLHSLESLLSYKPDIHLLIIDSVSAFCPVDGQRYWENRHALPDPNIKFISDILKKILCTFRVVVIVTNTSFDTKLVRGKRTADFLQNVTKKNICEVEKQKFVAEVDNNCRGNKVSVNDNSGMLSVWQMPVAHRFVFSKCFPPVVGKLNKQKDKCGAVPAFKQEMFFVSSSTHQNCLNYRFKIVAGGIEFIDD